MCVRRHRKARLCCLAVVVLGFATAQAAEPVSIESLLNEMIDRDSVARFPETDFRLKQHSSYSRASKTPDDPEGWFMNHDFNRSPQDKNFIRIEENNGQKEWVLMDHEGAGAIVRTWMPFRSVPENSLIRFYLDGAERAGARRECLHVAQWHGAHSLSAGPLVAAFGGFLLSDSLCQALQGHGDRTSRSSFSSPSGNMPKELR